MSTFEHLCLAGDLSFETYKDWPHWKHCIPFPSTVMMGTSGTHLLETYLAVGVAWWNVIETVLPTNAQVLDVGCGCGKVARHLALEERVGRYIGFDPIKACVEWNSRYIRPRAKGIFEFIFADLHSQEYNPAGTVSPRTYRFPADQSCIDVVLASSVFTHLLESDAIHYLKESARVLKRGGVAVMSIHDEPPAGVVYSGTEARIDVCAKYFVELASAAGLVLKEDLGSLCGQRAFIFSRVGR